MHDKYLALGSIQYLPRCRSPTLALLTRHLSPGRLYTNKTIASTHASLSTSVLTPPAGLRAEPVRKTTQLYRAASGSKGAADGVRAARAGGDPRAASVRSLALRAYIAAHCEVRGPPRRAGRPARALLIMHFSSEMASAQVECSLCM